MKNIKEKIKDGIELNTRNINKTRDHVKLAEDIIDLMIKVNLDRELEGFDLKVNSRVYEVRQDYIRYYSTNGRGKYYYLNNCDKFKDFVLRPTKKNRTIKLIPKDEKIA